MRYYFGVTGGATSPHLCSIIAGTMDPVAERRCDASGLLSLIEDHQIVHPPLATIQPLDVPCFLHGQREKQRVRQRRDQRRLNRNDAPSSLDKADGALPPVPPKSPNRRRRRTSSACDVDGHTVNMKQMNPRTPGVAAPKLPTLPGKGGSKEPAAADSTKVEASTNQVSSFRTAANTSAMAIHINDADDVTEQGKIVLKQTLAAAAMKKLNSRYVLAFGLLHCCSSAGRLILHFLAARADNAEKIPNVDLDGEAG